MDFDREGLEALAFRKAPPLNPDFGAYEIEKAKSPDPDLGNNLEHRRRAYAERCRKLFQQMTADGARDQYLAEGEDKKWLTLKVVSLTEQSCDIPVMQLDLRAFKNQEPDIVVIYIHGGGLYVGEADSEELTCRRILKAGLGCVRVYSVGYRLITPYCAADSVRDADYCVREFREVAKQKTILVGSSSGGQIAATLSQRYGLEASMTGVIHIHGVMLRAPVTADVHSGWEYIPERFRNFYTSHDDSFLNSMSFHLKRVIPRDGLPELPLEADLACFKTHPRTWIQVCTNDGLYSDGLCYAMALQEVGTEVRLHVIHGWPHTFWLVAPELPQSLEAENEMIEGMKWLLG